MKYIQYILKLAKIVDLIATCKYKYNNIKVKKKIKDKLTNTEFFKSYYFCSTYQK